MNSQRTHVSRHWLRTSCLLGCAALFLSACSIAPRAEVNSDWAKQREQLRDLDSWELRGRVNVRYDNDNDTPRILWSQQNVEYHIRLWGTFNVGSTTIVGRPGFVTLESDGEVLTANSPEDLILQQLGYELPVSQLNYWIKGLPAPQSVPELGFNELNQLTNISQDGWDINFPDPRQYGEITLPREVILTRARNDIRLRFIGLNWSLPETIN